MDIVNLNDFKNLARKKLPALVFDYYAGGSHDEISLHNNCKDYQKIALKYRVLVDVSTRDLSTKVLGKQISMPILIAPTAFHKMAHPQGEIATAKAAAKAKTIMILSTMANSSIEEVMAETTGEVWFQLYVYKDRGITKELVQRAENAGCKAIVLTVDLPLGGQRERDIRNNFQLPEGLAVANLLPKKLEKLPTVDDSGLTAYISSLFDPSLSWKDVQWLRELTNLPIFLKGIVRADDALNAVEHGASGIIISNHGGRQLDTAPSTISVLSEIVDATSDNLEILIDGGIRRGTDVVKALALGATGVCIGRPILWGLAVEGEQGVTNVLEMLRRDLDLAMALCGCPSIAHIDKSLIQ